MSQQPFTELPLPLKAEVTIMMQVVPKDEPSNCAEYKCSNNTVTGSYPGGLTQCGCCGQWFCDDHITFYPRSCMKREEYWGDFCPSCMAFTKPVRAAIMDFRKQLSELI